MKSISATIIGSTKIAEAHIYTIKKLGIQIIDIATRLGSKNVKNLKILYEINQKEILDWKNSINKNHSDLIIVANKSDFHKEISDYALNLGKYVLCEKPGWEEDTSGINVNINLLFSYNRRFYSWVNNLKKTLDNSKNKIYIDVNLVEFDKDFLKFYEIVSHYIDLSKHILGKKFSLSQSEFSRAENIFQISNPRFSINYRVWNNSPSNYSMNIQDGDFFYKISPTESLTKFEGFSIKDLTNFDKQYNPKVIANVIEIGEDVGFNNMYKMLFIGMKV